jgi:branched-chain amino acid transport system substrate-binding protein
MLRKIILWTLFGIFSVGCITWLAFLVLDASRSESVRWGAKKIRSERALRAKGPIVIGVAGDWQDSDVALLNGIKLALEEINTRGGVLARPLELVIRDDRMSVKIGRQIAQEFAENLDMVAVIGHPNSTVSLATAVMYEYYGLLMLSPLASNPALTLQGRQLVFRNIPTDEADGQALAEHAAAEGYQRIAIYYQQDDYARGLANIFERRCYELGIAIVDRLPYEVTYQERDFAADFDLWQRQFDFEAILLAGQLPVAGEIIPLIRRAGITVPILSGNSLDNDLLFRLAGTAAEGVTVVSSFDPGRPQAEVTAFVKNFEKKYGTIPDLDAAQGYDALHLVAHAITMGGSTVPEKMAATLRHVVNWPGVTGLHTFDDKGDVVGKGMVIKHVRDGSFRVAPPLD